MQMAAPENECPSYTDAFGNTRKAFFCPTVGYSPQEKFCCGEVSDPYCCRFEGHLIDERFSNGLVGTLSAVGIIVAIVVIFFVCCGFCCYCCSRRKDVNSQARYNVLTGGVTTTTNSSVMNQPGTSNQSHFVQQQNNMRLMVNPAAQGHNPQFIQQQNNLGLSANHPPQVNVQPHSAYPPQQHFPTHVGYPQQQMFPPPVNGVPVFPVSHPPFDSGYPSPQAAYPPPVGISQADASNPPPQNPLYSSMQNSSYPMQPDFSRNPPTYNEAFHNQEPPGFRLPQEADISPTAPPADSLQHPLS